MQPDNGAAQALAQRLRALRQEAAVTQPMLAAALEVSVPLVSAWESVQMPKIPPVARLTAIAAFYASSRSRTEEPAIPDRDSLSPTERRRMDEIRADLVRLRAAASANVRLRARGLPKQYRPPTGPLDAIGVQVDQRALAEPRSFIQQALDSLETFVQNPTTDTRATPERLIRLLKSAPELIGNPVFTDMELAEVEANVDWAYVYVVTSNDTIEFVYPAVGPSFATVVKANLERGVKYRYLVPDLPKTVERAKTLTALFDGLEVRFLSADYWRSFTTMIDELLIYQPVSNAGGQACQAFYLYPGSAPRKWISVDTASAQNRLQDITNEWHTAKETSER